MASKLLLYFCSVSPHQLFSCWADFIKESGFFFIVGQHMQPYVSKNKPPYELVSIWNQSEKLIELLSGNQIFLNKQIESI